MDILIGLLLLTIICLVGAVAAKVTDYCLRRSTSHSAPFGLFFFVPYMVSAMVAGLFAPIAFFVVLGVTISKLF